MDNRDNSTSTQTPTNTNKHTCDLPDGVNGLRRQKLRYVRLFLSSTTADSVCVAARAQASTRRLSIQPPSSNGSSMHCRH